MTTEDDQLRARHRKCGCGLFADHCYTCNDNEPWPCHVIRLLDRIAELADHATKCPQTTAQLERARAALREIVKQHHGLDGFESDAEQSAYWSRLALLYRDVARAALVEAGE